ncbi:imelysin family protein [Thauera linaloolentis]|uniref:Peptidase M75, Imelysin n=1 Tax=Thauera linaloolentis (strain DSM 12138 / JCM 21573 / CCUG 41526 / CIP 105981 / IAM 15112 / NBRC 102519 / 47Lol) TaxID=1123367 RepID=N6Z205_THAL4|nr:imelysin family protein [Thauera linaloolentis]ENO88652.1 peptidase M75, Imelysin [Thauera linaloolentis 47Lol = DSM 12138]MCM8565697.1 imelysin family protein [Thauera linaloolentis]
MSPRSSLSAAPFLAAALLSASAIAAAPAPFVAPSAWMSALGQQVLAPGYAELARSSAALAQGIGAACDAPGDGTLDAARAAWRQTALELRRLAALPFGPALESRILRRLDFWPTRPPQIESSLRGRAAGTLQDERIGVTAKGMPALEYLLFDPARAPLGSDPTACRYAAWLADDAARELDAIQSTWSPWVDSLGETDPETEAALLSDSVNILIGGFDTLRVKYLEKPARKPTDRTGFDAWRSGGERAHLLALFDGLRLGLQGREGLPGLTAILRGRGLLALADRLDAQTEAVAGALQGLPPSPGEDGGAAIARTVEALAVLQGLLAHDVAEKLKVRVGFGDNDGD